MRTTIRPSLSGALELLGGSAFVEMLSERQELLRFGASRVTYQHSEERLVVRVKLVREGRAVWGTLGSLDPAALTTLRKRLEAALQELPPNDAWLPSSADAPRLATTNFGATEHMDAARRAELFGRIVAGVPNASEVGGSIATTVLRHAIASSTGLEREEQRTRALVQVIGSSEKQSAYARTLHRDASALDIDGMLRSVNAALEPLPMRSLEPGTYRAVLEAPAVIGLLASLGQLAFNGRAFLDGESVFAGRMGEGVLSQGLTLTDDGVDLRGLPISFDCEGTPKARVPLLREGVLVGQCTDTVTARRMGPTSRSTGHATPLGWRFGVDPSPTHLVLEPGALSEDELLQACGSGLWIQRLDYVRVVNARQTLVTGTTRDATRWIEHGRVVARLPQFRLTLRLTDLFNSVEALGIRLERGEVVFMESIAAPAALVSNFAVDSVTA